MKVKESDNDLSSVGLGSQVGELLCSGGPHGRGPQPLRGLCCLPQCCHSCLSWTLLNHSHQSTSCAVIWGLWGRGGGGLWTSTALEKIITGGSSALGSSVSICHKCCYPVGLACYAFTYPLLLGLDATAKCRA